MRIKILFFAQLRESFSCNEREMDIEEGMTIKDLVQKLLDPDLQKLPLLYAIDEQLVSPDTILKSDNTLALIPPVAGG